MNKWNKFKEGMKNLTPAQQLHAQIVGHYGTIIGLIFAWVMMVIRGLWYFSIVMFFAIWLSTVALIGAKQKYKGMCELMQETGETGYTQLNLYGGKSEK